MSTRKEVTKDVCISSDWMCATEPSKDLADFAQIHRDGNLFDVTEDDYLDELVGPDTGFLLEDRSDGVEGSTLCPVVVSCMKDNLGFCGVIVITNCGVIEVYGPANAGYIQTSRGILLEKVDDTAFYSHTLNFTKGPVSQLELKMTNGTAGKKSITFFALHLYLTELAPPLRKSLNDPTMLALFSGLISPPRKIGQGDGVTQEKDNTDQIRGEMLRMEQRLTAHIDKQFDHMKKEIARQFDHLLLQMHGTSDRRSNPKS